MHTAYPLTVYFDASCALCDSEMQNIKRHDVENDLVLVDCSAPDFDDTPFHHEGITRQAMLNCLHARDANGNWLTGIAAFEVIYQAVGMATIARLWGHARVRPLSERAYPWVVRHRHLLSALGVHHLFGLWSRRAARRANERSNACKDGSCRIG